jgi:hypothetical protein
MTPAVAAGLTDKLMDMRDIVKLIDDAEDRRRAGQITKSSGVEFSPKSN